MVIPNRPILAGSLNEMVFEACKRVIIEGNVLPSRNGKAFEICDISLFLQSPKNRHLYLAGRTNNIYACFAEVLWVMSGDDKLHPLMNFFLPRAKDYSDDGLTWRAAYGNRLYSNNALMSCINSFLTDGPLTRQAVIAIHHADKDTDESIKTKYGLDNTKDRPCNNFIYFWIRDNRLNMKVVIRSNDTIFGLSAINVTEWTFLQEIVMCVLKNTDERFASLKLGYYHHDVVSLHIYESTSKQARNLISDEENRLNLQADETFPMNIGNLSLNFKQLFTGIYNCLCSISEDVDTKDIDDVFDIFGVPKYKNQLYHYAKLVEGFILNNKTKRFIPDNLGELSPDLKRAIFHNKFTPDTWKESIQNDKTY